MNALPASIEAYLQEAGFSSTEILILKRLMEDDALTLRQLAAKTGKSTGVLDQAMKKLMRKNIISKEWINDMFKFTLHSLQPISKWMADDMKRKREALMRKHQNFETFVTSLELDKHRPEMDFYNGDEGIRQVYLRLLECGKDMIQYFPVVCAIEDDPFRDFRVEYFRERRRRGIYSRVITHNTPLGRRFETRDPFEYRKTLLVPEDQYPFSFEKIVIGDTVTCFNLLEKRACFIRYPELATTERGIFEGIWRKESQTPRAASPGVMAAPQPVEAPLKTEVLSRVREFFLSRESIVSFAVFALVSAGVTFAIARNAAHLNMVRLQEQAKSIAATGAAHFDPRDLGQLRIPEDIRKPAYAKVIKQLNTIRYDNQWIKSAYLLRSSDGKGLFEFIAGADAQGLPDRRDVNGDGVLDDAGHLRSPGERYAVPAGVQSNEEVLLYPVGLQPSEDAWGPFIAGWAPIRDASGSTVAVLGVDVSASQPEERSISVPFIVGVFLGLFLLLILARVAALNRSLIKQIFEVLRETTWKGYIGFGFLFLLSLVLYVSYAASVNFQRLQENVLSITATGADQFSAADIAALQTEEDIHKPQWPKVVNQLKNIRLRNPDLAFVYLIRRDPQNLTRQLFISDSHSLNPEANTDADPSNDVDTNGDGKLDFHDLLQWPGQPYPLPPAEAQAAFERPIASRSFYEDQWGKFLSGYAPVYDENQHAVAVLAVDMRTDTLWHLHFQLLWPPFVFVGMALLLFALFKLAKSHRKVLGEVWRVFGMRKVVVCLIVSVQMAFFLTLGLYFFTLRLAQEKLTEKRK